MNETAEDVNPTEEIVEEVSEQIEISDEQDTEAEVNPEQETESDEVVVQIGEESPPQEQPAPEWVRELRKSHRELQREKRELEAQLRSMQQVTKPVEVGKKPQLEDFDYDADKFEVALAGWFDRKRQADEQARKVQQEQEQIQQAWQSKLQAYGMAKAELKVKDYEDAEELVQQNLNVTQQGIVIQGAENPALVVYALGKNPKKAKELASITDPVKFAFAIAKLETQLKVTNRKAAPPPETVIKGTTRMSGAVDSTLERLREEAERTGNYTKVMQYKKQLRSAKK
jgi:hypothetical protein